MRTILRVKTLQVQRLTCRGIILFLIFNTSQGGSYTTQMYISYAKCNVRNLLF